MSDKTQVLGLKLKHRQGGWYIMAEYCLKITRKTDENAPRETIVEQTVSTPFYNPALEREVLLCMAEELQKIATKKQYPSEE